MITLGIETSCDETAVAVVEDGFHVRANLIARQEHLHERYGGVVPEVAARAHVESLNPLLERALDEAGVGFRNIDGVAVTVGPGLVGALLVGMAAAKAVSLATRVPLIGVNHLEGHVWANFLEHGKPDPPYVALVVSGGHTMLVHMPGVHHHELLGQTLDDAAGEAFDKVARLLGLGFPGGPALDAMATEGDPRAIRFPRAMEDSGDLDFSMSGLKTAVLRYVRAEQAAGRDDLVPGRRRLVPGGDRGCAGLEDRDGGQGQTGGHRSPRRRRGGEHQTASADDRSGGEGWTSRALSLSRPVHGQRGDDRDRRRL